MEDINRIRFLNMVDKEGEDARNLKKLLHNAMESLSADLYSVDTHFVLELVQNADDNRYLEGVVPFLSLKAGPHGLLLENNESGFTYDNLKALSSVGMSTKKKSEGFIGEKGAWSGFS